MKKKEDEIKKIYELCRVGKFKTDVKNKINRGNLNKKLNCDFSNVFGNNSAVTYTNYTSMYNDRYR